MPKQYKDGELFCNIYLLAYPLALSLIIFAEKDDEDDEVYKSYIGVFAAILLYINDG